jgi:tellurite resistance protein TerC
MNTTQITYLVFGIVLIVAIIIDLGLITKKDKKITLKDALWTSVFWIALGLAFGVFIWFEKGQATALEYFSAYLMEKSLSIDNIFVFILIFSFFKIRGDHVARALLMGILMAIVFRVIFITIGIALVERFYWILYFFGAFLVYTGIKIFTVRHEAEFDPEKNPVYRFLKKYFRIIPEDVSGQITIKKDGKRFYTNMFLVIVLLATTDIVFALDSIPAVFAITQDKLVIYTSNIFAVLGLRSLFFLLKGAVRKFEYLQQGIAIVLIFIGAKMLVDYFGIHVPIYISLMVIVICLSGSIAYSLKVVKQRNKKKKLNLKNQEM